MGQASLSVVVQVTAQVQVQVVQGWDAQALCFAVRAVRLGPGLTPDVYHAPPIYPRLSRTHPSPLAQYACSSMACTYM